MVLRSRSPSLEALQWGVELIELFQAIFIVHG
jgi:hypothetical protein